MSKCFKLTIKAIINDLYTRMNKDRHTANAFAIFFLMFIFGVRASECICNPQRFYLEDKSCVDMDKALDIRGTIRHNAAEIV